jgi:hypothetical protein
MQKFPKTMMNVHHFFMMFFMKFITIFEKKLKREIKKVLIILQPIILYVLHLETHDIFKFINIKIHYIKRRFLEPKETQLKSIINIKFRKISENSLLTSKLRSRTWVVSLRFLTYFLKQQ